MNSSPASLDLEGLALAEACHAGNLQAQRMLWKRYKDRMFGVCLRFTANRQDAEDLLQEAFVRVFHGIGGYRGDGSLEGWIRRIVVRTAIQVLQKQRDKTEMMDEASLDYMLFDIDNTLLDVEDETPGRLIALLQKLPPGFRAVLNLYAIENHSHEEIARALNISVGTSKSQLHRAKAFMRRLLDKTLLLL